MGAYDDSLRLQFLSLRDTLVTQFQASGLIFAERVVYLVYGDYVAADQTTGAAGTFTEASRLKALYLAIDLKTQYRWVSGASVVVGDAKIKLSRTYTEEQIRSASWIEVDGIRYTLEAGDATIGTAGGLERAKNGLDWNVTVNVMRTRAIEPTPL
jgi:hypothetical protein